MSVSVMSGLTPIFPDLAPGQILWAELSPVEGREQGGRRPVVVVSSALYLDLVDSLAYVLPVSTTDHGWPNHIRVSALERPSWALTEQIRTISRSRLHGTLGVVTDEELDSIRAWLERFTV